MAERLLFLDCDGTLVDSRRRQHALFLELAPQARYGFDEYWTRKRAGANQGRMLADAGVTDPQALEQFRVEWLRRIEEPARLAQDTLLPGAAEFLDRAAGRWTRVLVTGRQSREHLLVQLAQLGIADRLDVVLNTEQRLSKPVLVRSRYAACRPGDLFVGDTGEDILAGKELGVRTVAVLSGATDEGTLARYAPDRVVASVAALDAALLEPAAA